MALSTPGYPKGGLRLPALLVLALGLAGCRGVGGGADGSMETVPPEWRKTNPWGPVAIAARERGELKPLFYTAQMAADAQWARENLEDGDVLFRYGKQPRLADWVANGALTGISDSCFTHDAVVFHQGADVWVYDVQPEPEGVRKIPYEFWALETRPGTMAVKRLRPEYRPCIPQALAYCEAQWLRQPAFDTALRLDDERLYCSEMIEKAFRSAGLVLSDPTRICCLPHYRRYHIMKPIVDAFTDLDVHEPAFSLGNPCYGTFGSPCLELVFGGEDRKGNRPPKGPICPPTPFPAEAVAPVAPGPPVVSPGH
jgi:hypothetical protein